MCSRTSRWGRLFAWAVLFPAMLGFVSEGYADEQSIYRYVGKKGRPVFVNGKDRVPERFQSKAKAVDLSKISTNQKLGQELKQSVDEQVEKMVASGYCFQLRRTAQKQGFLATLWVKHSALLLIGGLMLLLLLITPAMIKRMEPPKWGRILLFTLPLLALLGLWTTAIKLTSDKLDDLKASVSRCDRQTYEKVGSSPQGQKRRLSMLDKLKQDIMRAQKRRNDTLKHILDGQTK